MDSRILFSMFLVACVAAFLWINVSQRRAGQEVKSNLERFVGRVKTIIDYLAIGAEGTRSKRHKICDELLKLPASGDAA